MKNLYLCSFLFLNIFMAIAQSNKAELLMADKLSIFPNVRDFTYDHNSEQMLFSVQNYVAGRSAIIQVNKVDGSWQKPQVASFSGLYNDLEPFFSEDGLELYFASNRPLHKDSSKTKDFDIWKVSRPSVKGKWSEPINLGTPVNTDKDEFFPAITNSGNLYITLDKKSGEAKDDIYICEFKNGAYTAPKSLAGGINTNGYEFNAYVAPDESFIIFSGYNREDGFGSGDLYISRNEGNGSWSQAKNLGSEINSDKLDYCPFVDLKDNTLYFTSMRLNHSPDPQAKVNIDLLTDWFKKKDGLSKLYKIDFSDWVKQE